MTKKERVIGAIVGLILLVSVGVFITSFREADVISEKEVLELFKDGEQKDSNMHSGSETQKDNVNLQSNVEEKKNIVVEIKGEVKKPNVYTLSEGSRVNELINKAGGLTQEADIENINRASLINDGQCIVIGNINDTDEEKAQLATLQNNNVQNTASSTNDNGIINLNTASVEQLQTLTGIGASKASAIIEYRESSGGFKSIEDIKNISGIGEKTFEKIKDSLTV